MREPVRDKGRLEHMQNAIERVVNFIAEKSMDDMSEIPAISPVEFLRIMGVE